METIICENGQGKRKNPHEEYNQFCIAQDIEYYKNPKWEDFEATNPELPCYLPSGELFLEEGEFSGEKKRIARKPANSNWKIVEDEAEEEYYSEFGCDFADCYIIHPSPKRSGLDLKKLDKEVDDLIATHTAEDYRSDFEAIDAAVEGEEAPPVKQNNVKEILGI